MDEGCLELDHLFIWVAPDAPEKEAFVKAGFRLDEEVNVHEGQGTASITFSFENAYIELIWVTDEDAATRTGQTLDVTEAAATEFGV